MLKKLIVLLVMALAAVNCEAQYTTKFNQYLFNQLYINPAYAGYKNDLSVSSIYRSQWTGIDGAPKTIALAADGMFDNKNVGIGLTLQSDRVGAQNFTAVYGNYAYKIKLSDFNDSKISFGLGFGLIQSGINGSKLVPGQENDNVVPVGDQSNILPDARFGFLYSNEHLFFGASVDNLLANFFYKANGNFLSTFIPKPNEYLTAGALLVINEDMKFKPSILLRDGPENPTNIDFNTAVILKDRIGFGFTYRTDVNLYNKAITHRDFQRSNAMVAYTSFSINGNISIGYAFDYSLSKIDNASYGSHQLSIGFHLQRASNLNDSNLSTF
ncbi:type IX secretion system membrane protein PorP/SprF [Mucilaginibacter conchicola]|uniref:Type IX secretion system membrane protein PorP/SprF n=1 Tax=Mucilaginibacter conchicola TaxID=2303333 RepID=A0A372NXM2_9SPHI|nr:type IX secretion system membrane protein PorP/SprF [Mucilaginibacter conchicola]RFZ94860.1 type IX secretion system membrane protein PorP/SprF [Mucilaginibacter conchicola]